MSRSAKRLYGTEDWKKEVRYGGSSDGSTQATLKDDRPVKLVQPREKDVARRHLPPSPIAMREETVRYSRPNMSTSRVLYRRSSDSSRQGGQIGATLSFSGGDVVQEADEVGKRDVGASERLVVVETREGDDARWAATRRVRRCLRTPGQVHRRSASAASALRGTPRSAGFRRGEGGSPGRPTPPGRWRAAAGEAQPTAHPAAPIRPSTPAHPGPATRRSPGQAASRRRRRR